VSVSNATGWDGPIESNAFPSQLLARVITPGHQPCVHGYDVHNDLALHYNLTELAYLALTGDLPEPHVTLALNAALIICAPVSVAQAPTHAAVLSQLCGAEPSATLGVAAIALAEQARHTVAAHRSLLEWLNDTSQPFPETFQATHRDDLDSLGSLKLALRPSRLEVPGLQSNPTLLAAILLVLHACGLRGARQMESLLVWARLPLVLAEAFAESEANFKNYPINLPHFNYEEPEP